MLTTFASQVRMRMPRIVPVEIAGLLTAGMETLRSRIPGKMRHHAVEIHAGTIHAEILKTAVCIPL